MAVAASHGWRVVNLVYLAVAVFIAWGRFGPYSFQ